MCRDVQPIRWLETTDYTIFRMSTVWDSRNRGNFASITGKWLWLLYILALIISDRSGSMMFSEGN